MTNKTASLPHVLRAAEKAEDDDRRWFESHPTRRYRLRNIHMFEFNGHDGSHQIMEGATYRVIASWFATARPDARSPKIMQRIPCILPDWLPNSGERDELPDKEIKWILDYWLGYVKTIGP